MMQMTLRSSVKKGWNEGAVQGFDDAANLEQIIQHAVMPSTPQTTPKVSVNNNIDKELAFIDQVIDHPVFKGNLFD